MMNIKDLNSKVAPTGAPLRNEISLSLRLFLNDKGFIPISGTEQHLDSETFISTTSDDVITVRILDDPLTRASTFVSDGWTEWHGMYAMKMEYKMFIYYALVSPQDLRDAIGIDKTKEALRRVLRGVCEDENETLRSELVRDGYILLLHNTEEKIAR